MDVTQQGIFAHAETGDAEQSMDELTAGMVCLVQFGASGFREVGGHEDESACAHACDRNSIEKALTRKNQALHCHCSYAMEPARGDKR